MYTILRKNKLNDFKLQLEDWSKEYPNTYKYGSTLIVYKEAKEDIGTIKRHSIARFEYDFNSHDEAIKAYDDLLEGRKTPIDFIEYLHDPKYAVAL